MKVADSISLPNVKQMSIKEFTDFGFLQEVNRQFLHPLGLCMGVVNPTGGIVMLDCRDDPAGVFFERFQPGATERRDRVRALLESKRPGRVQKQGWLEQEVIEPQHPKAKTTSPVSVPLTLPCSKHPVVIHRPQITFAHDVVHGASVGFYYSRIASRLYFAMAFCNTTDRFVKATARSLIENRLNDECWSRMMTEEQWHAIEDVMRNQFYKLVFLFRGGLLAKEHDPQSTVEIPKRLDAFMEELELGPRLREYKRRKALHASHPAPAKLKAALKKKTKRRVR